MNKFLSLILLSIVSGEFTFGQPTGDKNNLPAILHDGDQVLFIGNSKVGSEGGLHHHFRRVTAQASPPLTIQTDWPSMYNKPTLKDMYTDEIVKRIHSGTDNVIVVSSGSEEAMRQFARIITENHRQMVLFATWADNPLLDSEGWSGFRRKTQLIVDEVQRFENNTGIPVVPSGLIFYDLLVNPIKYPGLREDYLFVPGSSVQNDLGTLVNVSTIYAVTTGRSPVGLWFWNPFSAELVKAVQERVWKIVNEWKSGKVVLDTISEPGMLMTRKKMDIKIGTIEWPPILKDGDRIFYVGNSFIGTEGGLENHFQRIIQMVNPPLHIAQSSQIFWGQGLNRMYTNDVVEEIESGRNDLVVVTSGPSDILDKFYKIIKVANSTMMVHMTWGRNPTINDHGLEGYREQTTRIVEETRNFENETGVAIAPCGLVLYDLTIDPPAIPGLRLDWLYMVENIHQNHIGTMVNAATHYAVMTGRSPVGLPMWDPYPEELVKAVQERAWQIVQDWKAGKIKIKPIP